MDKTSFTANGSTLTIERIFPADASKVWDAWSSGDAFSKWWGPKGWDTTIKEYQFSPGGTLHYGMTCNDPAQGDWYLKTSWGKMILDTVTPMTYFSYTDYFCDENGLVDESMPSTYAENTLEAVEGGTKFTSVAHYKSEADLKTVIDMGMQSGIADTWDRLEDLVSDLS